MHHNFAHIFVRLTYFYSVTGESTFFSELYHSLMYKIRKQHIFISPVFINNQAVERMHQYKYLGPIIYEQLTFNFDFY